MKKSDKGIPIISYLQWSLKKDVYVLVDLPCYTSPSIQDDFWKKIWESCQEEGKDSSDENTEIAKILAPLTNNPNAPNEIGSTPIYLAAQKLSIYWPLWQTILMLLTILDKLQYPKYRAVSCGYTEIVKILAPSTNNPNNPNNDGETPIYKATQKRHTEIVKYHIFIIKSRICNN